MAFSGSLASYGDRTSEFQSLTERLKKIQTPGSSSDSNGLGNNAKISQSATLVPSDFNKRASRIGLGIHETSQKIARLAKNSEANDPVYNQLCQPIHENLLGPNSQIHEERVGGDTVKGILHDILLSGDGADNYTRGASDINVQDKFVFFDNPTFQGNASAKARLRALRSRGKRSQKHMSMRQHRQCGSFDFPRKYQRYDIFLPMHEMWKEYIGELLRNCRKKSIEQCLLAADFHGAILAVVESKNKSFIGVQGIMVRETVNTFGILTSENKFRVVPKKGSVFIFQFDFWRVTLHGDKLPSRKLNQADT